jgi:hypothetical protein
MAAHEAAVPNNILNRLDHYLNNPPAEARRWLHEEMTRINNREQTHPCLSERLKTVGFVFRGHIPPAPGPSNSSADHWLANHAAMASTFNTEWQATHAEMWEHAHENGARLLKRRDALHARYLSDELSQDEHWELVTLTHHFDGADAAQPVLMAFIALNPHHSQALYRLGADLLEEGDARGIPFIEGAMFYDRDAIVPGCAVLRDFADAYGHRALVEDAESKLEAHADLEVMADAERSKAPTPEQLRPHNLTNQQVATLQGSLIPHEVIIAADVAQVLVQHIPERAHYLVIIHLATSWWSAREEDADQKLIMSLMETISLPGTCVIVFGEKSPKLTKAVADHENARVFTRE